MGAIPGFCSGSQSLPRSYFQASFRSSCEELFYMPCRCSTTLCQRCFEQCSVKCEFFCPNRYTSCHVVIIWASLLILFSLKSIFMTNLLYSEYYNAAAIFIERLQVCVLEITSPCVFKWALRWGVFWKSPWVCLHMSVWVIRVDAREFCS